MKTVIIASTNPVKVEVAKLAFTAMSPGETFDFVAHSSESGVPDQPTGDDQTIEGAKNRLIFIKQAFPTADYYISQEGGVTDDGDEMQQCAYILIEDNQGNQGRGKTAIYIVPPKIASLVRGGMELGHATDEFFSLTNSKHGGALIGQLTDQQITRTQFYLQAAIIALSQIKHKEWFLKSV